MTTRKEQIEQAAKEFTENYITMNNRPAHRPDVLQHAFITGWESADKNPNPHIPYPGCVHGDLKEMLIKVEQEKQKLQAEVEFCKNQWDLVCKKLEKSYEKSDKLQAALAVAKKALEKIEGHGFKLGGEMFFSDESQISTLALQKIEELEK